MRSKMLVIIVVLALVMQLSVGAMDINENIDADDDASMSTQVVGLNPHVPKDMIKWIYENIDKIVEMEELREVEFDPDDFLLGGGYENVAVFYSQNEHVYDKILDSKGTSIDDMGLVRDEWVFIRYNVDGDPMSVFEVTTNDESGEYVFLSFGGDPEPYIKNIQALEKANGTNRNFVFWGANTLIDFDSEVPTCVVYGDGEYNNKVVPFSEYLGWRQQKIREEFGVQTGESVYEKLQAVKSGEVSLPKGGTGELDHSEFVPTPMLSNDSADVAPNNMYLSIAVVFLAVLIIGTIIMIKKRKQHG